MDLRKMCNHMVALWPFLSFGTHAVERNVSDSNGHAQEFNW